MNRRAFLAASGAAALAGHAVAADAAPAQADEIKHAVEAYYAAYRGLDKAKYRACLSADYLLLENGELLDADGDLASMAGPGSGYERTDAFDFRAVRVHNNTAYAVYFLSSDIKDAKGPRHRDYLESMILRRAAGVWRTAVLHSTRVVKEKG